MASVATVLQARDPAELESGAVILIGPDFPELALREFPRRTTHFGLAVLVAIPRGSRVKVDTLNRRLYVGGGQVPGFKQRAVPGRFWDEVGEPVGTRDGRGVLVPSFLDVGSFFYRLFVGAFPELAAV